MDSGDLIHECGIAAAYLLKEPYNDGDHHRILDSDDDVVPLIPRILLDLQNRGQLAAGLSTYHPQRDQLIMTYKDIGTVSEVFRMSHPAKHLSVLREHAGCAAIAHTRYATVGRDDVRYAQPFERHHGRRWKWFSFAFNGTLANYNELKARLLARQQYHFTLNADTEIIMHMLSYGLRGDDMPCLPEVMRQLASRFDGAYNIVFLDAMGRMMVTRDPLGIRPLAWGVEGRLFVAASESVALQNLGFTNIHHLQPGEMIIIEDGKLSVVRYTDSPIQARCFFEWIYFANVASEIDGLPVYTVRSFTGNLLAKSEPQPIDEDCIVVPVPDTAKAAADAFAYRLKIPCVEGIIRNRYVGRTFIQSTSTRNQSVRSKYTVLRSVLEGKRVFLLEDSIVRSTTMRALAQQIYTIGKAKEIHVRIASPPIIAPCFYGIDMSTIQELFAPSFLNEGDVSIAESRYVEMAKKLGVDSLRYLSLAQLKEALHRYAEHLCTGCLTAQYPTPMGQELYLKAKKNAGEGKSQCRTLE